MNAMNKLKTRKGRVQVRFVQLTTRCDQATAILHLMKSNSAREAAISVIKAKNDSREARLDVLSREMPYMEEMASRINAVLRRNTILDPEYRCKKYEGEYLKVSFLDDATWWIKLANHSRFAFVNQGLSRTFYVDAELAAMAANLYAASELSALYFEEAEKQEAAGDKDKSSSATERNEFYAEVYHSLKTSFLSILKTRKSRSMLYGMID